MTATTVLRSAGVLAAAAALALALVGCAPSSPASDTETPAASTAGATPSAESESPDEADTPEPEEPAEPELTGTERQAIVDAVIAGDAAVLAAAMSDPVDYILASSECCGPTTPAAAFAELTGYTSGETGWTSPVDPVYVEQVRGSYFYGDLVPADVITLRSSSGLVVILGITGDRITSVLVGGEDTLLF